MDSVVTNGFQQSDLAGAAVFRGMENVVTNGFQQSAADADLAETRTAMIDYWKIQAADSVTEVEMMMDIDAVEFGSIEIPEVMSYIPDYTGMRVLELGSGIGRYTKLLAEKSKQVVTVDFIKKFIDENEKLNGHFKNIIFQVADATKMELKPRSFDMVFTNWLLMYLVDKEVVRFLRNVLEWLDEDGYFFIRESILHTGGNKPRGTDPSCYRDHTWYHAAIRAAVLECDDNHCYKYNVIMSRPLKCYIKHRNNYNQAVWLLQKVKYDKTAPENNNLQFCYKSIMKSNIKILQCENFLGKAFLNFGGLQMTKTFVKQLNVKKTDNVLEFGCGIGGTSLYIAKEYGATVLGVDLTHQVINVAMKRMKEAGLTVDQIYFEMLDPKKRYLPDASFDLICSRDTIMRVEDKLSLFKTFMKWLKPGGRMLISDFCCRDGQRTDSFQDYLTQKGYWVESATWYNKALQSAGFTNVKTEDKTEQFKEVIKKTIADAESAEKQRGEVNKDDAHDIINDWKLQLTQAEAGQLTWVHFYAEKA